MRSTARPAIRSASPALLAFLLTLLYLGTVTASAADADEDLLEFLIKQNEAAHARLRSYAYTIEIESENFVRQRAVKTTGEVKRRGRHLFAISASSQQGPFGPLEHRVVVNDKYAAYWPRGNPIAYRVDHESIETMDKRTRSHVDIGTPSEPLPYCFGDSERRFRDALKQLADTKWDAVEARDATDRLIYHVRRFAPRMDDPAKPDAVWIIDPDKGFLATEHVGYAPAGGVWIRHVMHLKELSPGLWFPVEHVETRYVIDPAVAANTVTTRRRSTLKDVKLNPDLPDEQFQVDALRLRQDMPGVTVAHTSLDGKTVPYVYHEGTLIPKAKAERGRGSR